MNLNLYNKHWVGIAIDKSTNEINIHYRVSLSTYTHNSKKAQKRANVADTSVISVIPLKTGIWGNIRRSIIKMLGKEGDAIDLHWFSKLEAEINDQAKQIVLKSESEFAKDYILGYQQHFCKKVRSEEKTPHKTVPFCQSSSFFLFLSTKYVPIGITCL